MPVLCPSVPVHVKPPPNRQLNRRTHQLRDEAPPRLSASQPFQRLSTISTPPPQITAPPLISQGFTPPIAPQIRHAPPCTLHPRPPTDPILRALCDLERVPERAV